MDLETQFRQSLNSDNPSSALYDLLIELRKQEISKSVLIDELGKLRQLVDDETEDIILENLDFLVGFCSPHMKIL